MEKTAADLEDIPNSESDAARALSAAQPANRKVREAADARLRFEDEPAGYLAVLGRDA